MSLQQIILEMRTLTIEERKQLMIAIIDSITDDTRKKRSIRDFRGVGEHLRDTDAQEYVNQLRGEWDHRP